jgi:hypothetical protein
VFQKKHFDFFRYVKGSNLWNIVLIDDVYKNIHNLANNVIFVTTFSLYKNDKNYLLKIVLPYPRMLNSSRMDVLPILVCVECKYRGSYV